MPLRVPPPAPTQAVNSQLLGDWVTQRKDIVKIYRCDSDLCLRILYVNPSAGHTTDGLNPDAAERGRPLCGLVIGNGFYLTDTATADGGKLYDPESGHTYKGTITLTSASTLKLHGYIGFSVFGRTEDWTRAQAGHPFCQ